MRTLFILELKRALKSPFFWLSLLVPLGINAEHLLFSECGFTIYTTSYFFVNAPIIYVILAILIPIHIGHDFETRTINNKITAGCTKKDIFLAEVGVGAVLATLLFVIVSLAVVAFSNIKHHTVDPNFTLTRLLANAFISWLGLVTVSTFFTMLAMLTHRQLISIAMPSYSPSACWPPAATPFQTFAKNRLDWTLSPTKPTITSFILTDSNAKPPTPFF